MSSIITVTIGTRGSENLSFGATPRRCSDLVERFRMATSRALNQVWGLLSAGAAAFPEAGPVLPGSSGQSAGGGVSEDDFYKSPFRVPSHMCILHSATDFRTLEFRLTPEAARNSMRGIQIQSQPPNQRPGQAGTLDKLEQRSHPSFALFSYSLCL